MWLLSDTSKTVEFRSHNPSRNQRLTYGIAYRTFSTILSPAPGLAELDDRRVSSGWLN